MKTFVVVFTCLFLISGCKSAFQTTKNYQIGKTMTATVGQSMVKVTAGSHFWDYDGTIQDDRILDVLVGRQLPMTRELIYSGVAGTTLRITYREFIDGYVRGDFKQDLTYNLKDNSITFKEFELAVVRANSRSIQFIVKKDPQEEDR